MMHRDGGGLDSAYGRRGARHNTNLLARKKPYLLVGRNGATFLEPTQTPLNNRYIRCSEERGFVAHLYCCSSVEGRQQFVQSIGGQYRLRPALRRSASTREVTSLQTRMGLRASNASSASTCVGGLAQQQNACGSTGWARFPFKHGFSSCDPALNSVAS